MLGAAKTASKSQLKAHRLDVRGAVLLTSAVTAVGTALLPAVAEGVSGGVGVSGDRAAMFTAALAALTATAVAWRAARPVPARAAS